MSRLEIDYLAPKALKSSKRNARTHSKKQIRQIADSIREFGFTNPILIDSEQMVLAGHGRLAAARLLGLEQVPCVRLERMTPAQAQLEHRLCPCRLDGGPVGPGWQGP